VQQPWVYSGFCPDPLYSWVFGDGSGLSASTPNQLASHVYNQPGSYEAQCTVHCPTVVFAVGQQLEAAAPPPNVTFSEDENQKYGFHRDDSLTYWKSLKAGDTDTVKINVVPGSAFDQVTVSSPESGLTASPQILSQVPEVITVGDLNGQDGVVDALFGSQVIDNLNVQVYTEREITVAYRRVDALPGLGYPGFVSGDIAEQSVADFEQEMQRIWGEAVVKINFTRLDPCEVNGIDLDWNTFVPTDLSDPPTLTQEQINVMRECRSPPEIHDYTIFLVNAENEIGVPRGVAASSEGVAFIHMTVSFDRARTTAHEIGHLLSLPDIFDVNNLMVSGGFGKELTNEQWDALR